MERDKIEELILKYNAQQADPSEIKLIEKLIEEGTIDLDQLHELGSLDNLVMKAETPIPSSGLDDNFYQMLGTMKPRNSFSWKRFFSWPELMPKLAVASVALIIGFSVGHLAFLSSGRNEVAVLTQEVSVLKEMIMLTLLKQESATERLKAVSLTSDMTRVSDKVTNALLQTLNYDENINVRLEALEALKPFVRDSRIRSELVRSIGKQESPLVLVALAELMVELQEKSSVQELQKILKDDKTPREVKNRIEAGIKTLV